MNLGGIGGGLGLAVAGGVSPRPWRCALVLCLAGCSATVGSDLEPTVDPAAEPRATWEQTGKGDGAPSRADWVSSEISDWNAGLGEEDREAKLEKMAASAFAFYRGTDHLFWADLSHDPRLEAYGGTTETQTWLCGDLHAVNYGAFTDDGGEVVYDVNDFDESIVADYQMDVWRMSTSILLLAWENGLATDDANTAIDAFAEHYLDTLAEVRGNDAERAAEWDLTDAYGRLDEFLQRVIDDEGRGALLARWTVEDREGRHLNVADADLEAVDADLRDAIEEAMPDYGATLSGGLDYDVDYFRVLDVARRLDAGTGSLGSARYYVLLDGPSAATDDDVILDVKRQGAPVGYAYMSVEARERYDASFGSHAERAVIAQRSLLTDVDDHVGWMRFGAAAYSVRERTPHREAFPVEELDTVERLTKLAEQWGIILAIDHARADRDFDPRYVPTSFDAEVDDRTDGDHAGFRALNRAVADEYAAQVLEDYASFVDRL